MSSAIRAASWALAIAAITYFVAFVIPVIQDPKLWTALQSWSAVSISLAAIAYFSIIPVSAWAWRSMLTSMHVTRPWLVLNYIMGVSQIAKYVPGNVGQHVGRFVIATRQGIGVSAFASTVTFETTLAVASSALTGSAALLVFLIMRKQGIGEHMEILAVAAAVFCCCVTVPFGALRYAPHLTRRLFPDRSTSEPAMPTLQAALKAFVAYSINYVVVGLGLFAIARTIGGVEPLFASLCIAVFSLSWLVGFLAPGAPAGIGVREGTMLAMFGPFLDNEIALAAILAFRTASVAGDLLSLLWGLLAKTLAIN